MTTSTCVRCDRPLFRRHSPHPIPEGMVRHAGRGLCAACYEHAHRPLIRGRGRPVGSRSDIDPIAVERAVAGDQVRLGTAERRAAVAELTRCGVSAYETARIIGLTPRSVQRIRARLRQQDAA